MNPIEARDTPKSDGQLILLLQRDRAELIEALNGMLGLVQLIASADGQSHLKNHRFVTAARLIERLKWLISPPTC